MAYDISYYSKLNEESSVNIQFGWVLEICKLISEINGWAKLCNLGEYGYLRHYYSSLKVLFNHLYSRISEDTKESLIKKFNDTLRLIEKFENIVPKMFGIYGDLLKQKKGQEILLKLTEIDNSMRIEMKLKGIEQSIKVSGREALERDWLEKW